LGHKRLSDLGFGRQRCQTPGLLIPLWGVDGGGIVGYQFRPDNPRLNNKGKPIKYETPRGATNRIDCPPACQKLLANPNVPLWITEGVKKGDALASQGECVIDLTGIWNWRSKNSLGGITVSSDFDSIALNDRQVYVAFDSDYTSNPNVSQAAKRLAELLKPKKASVSIVLLPPGNNGTKIGVDDFLAGGHTIAELKALLVPAEEMEEENQANEVFTGGRRHSQFFNGYRRYHIALLIYEYRSLLNKEFYQGVHARGFNILKNFKGSAGDAGETGYHLFANGATTSTTTTSSASATRVHWGRRCRRNGTKNAIFAEMNNRAVDVVTGNVDTAPVHQLPCPGGHVP
jgi:hypothetical protein